MSFHWAVLSLFFGSLALSQEPDNALENSMLLEKTQEERVEEHLKNRLCKLVWEKSEAYLVKMTPSPPLTDGYAILQFSPEGAAKKGEAKSFRELELFRREELYSIRIAEDHYLDGEFVILGLSREVPKKMIVTNKKTAVRIPETAGAFPERKCFSETVDITVAPPASSGGRILVSVSKSSH